MTNKIFKISLCVTILILSAHCLAMDDGNIEATIGNVIYVFGPDNGLIKIKTSGGAPLYNFGDHPCWFMLTYLHQTDSPELSHAEYYYPQTGVNNPHNNFVGRSYDVENIPPTLDYL